MRQFAHRILRPRRGKFVAGLVVGTLLAGGVAVAAIPNSTSGQISACYPTSGFNKGVLRVTEAATCPAGSTRVSWQSKGLRYAGTWSATASYSANDVVTSGDGTYVARKASTGTAVSNGTYWASIGARTAGGPSHGRTIVADHVAASSANLLGNASLAIGTDGFPVMAWQEDGGVVQFGVCTRITCTEGASTAQIDTGLTAMTTTSVAIGDDGLPIIALHEYRAGFQSPLVVIACLDAYCVTSVKHTVDPTNVFVSPSSLLIAPDGNPTIVYQAVSNNEIFVAHCTDPQCANSVTPTGINTSGIEAINAVIGSDGKLLIVTQEDTATNASMIARHCNDLTCSTRTTSVIDASNKKEQASSVAIGTDGRALIAYTGFVTGSNIIGLARCNDVVCSSATFTTLNGIDGTGEWPTLTIDAAGRPVIATRDVSVAERRILITRCTDPSCSATTSVKLPQSGWANGIALATGGDGLPVAAYTDNNNRLVRVVHIGRSSWTAGVYGG